MVELQPEIILPEQLRQQRQPLPEERLWRASLLQVIDTLRGSMRVPLDTFDDDYEWITCDAVEPFSFLYVCSLFDLDASLIREKVLPTAEKVRKRIVRGEMGKKCCRCKKRFEGRGRLCSDECRRAYETPLAGVPKHGVRTAYRAGCRCLPCRESNHAK